uniref:Uncharacterized protein n=1 Tax=Acrobeloides nanus TaxID=290746 RepID=A0A914E0S6_9BILA
MGQRISNNSFFKASTINWEEFVQLINEINIRCIKVKKSGSYISFAVKKGTDETFLWKHTIRICCLKKVLTICPIKWRIRIVITIGLIQKFSDFTFYTLSIDRV